ncbi:MAG: hypothetical protein FWF56_06045 [Firmicutes bacterium]|nr:hypothetical protein [Bacillota bacterium]MCL1953458.1 hypothetical protein [Bacillota bacterium]
MDNKITIHKDKETNLFIAQMDKYDGVVGIGSTVEKAVEMLKIQIEQYELYLVRKLFG